MKKLVLALTFLIGASLTPILSSPATAAQASAVSVTQAQVKAQAPRAVALSAFVPATKGDIRCVYRHQAYGMSYRDYEVLGVPIGKKVFYARTSGRIYYKVCDPGGDRWPFIRLTKMTVHFNWRGTHETCGPTDLNGGAHLKFYGWDSVTGRNVHTKKALVVHCRHDTTDFTERNLGHLARLAYTQDVRPHGKVNTTFNLDNWSDQHRSRRWKFKTVY
jgi:hypothetical protein